MASGDWTSFSELRVIEGLAAPSLVSSVVTLILDPFKSAECRETR